MNYLLRFTALAVAAISALSANGQGINRISLGEAADYNILVFGDFSSPYYSSTTGRLAAKGNIVLNNYGMATGLTGADAGISVIAGGNMTFQYGKVYAGHILVSGSADGVGPAVTNGLSSEQLLVDQVDAPLDFAQLETDLIDKAHSLSQFTANGAVESRYGGLYLTGDCQSDLQVFQLNGTVLLQAHTFEISCIPAGASVLFNISGTAAGLTYMSMESLKPHRERVLFNFFEATSLNLTSIGIHGSILAPKAHIQNPTGETHGTIIAKSWNGPMHLDYVRYKGHNESKTVCDGPITF